VVKGLTDKGLRWQYGRWKSPILVKINGKIRRLCFNTQYKAQNCALSLLTLLWSWTPISFDPHYCCLLLVVCNIFYVLFDVFSASMLLSLIYIPPSNVNIIHCYKCIINEKYGTINGPGCHMGHLILFIIL